jgi:hypothetical protein
MHFVKSAFLTKILSSILTITTAKTLVAVEEMKTIGMSNNGLGYPISFGKTASLVIRGSKTSIRKPWSERYAQHCALNQKMSKNLNHKLSKRERNLLLFTPTTT